MRTLIYVSASAVAVAAMAYAQAPVNGAGIPAKFNCENALVLTQTACTGYGNSTAVPPNGNEMNQLFMQVEGQNLRIGITGNVEQNGNAFLILLDTVDGGQATLNTTNVGGPPFAMNGLHNSTFDPGFVPDYGFAVDTFDGTAYISRYLFIDGLDAIRDYLGSDPVNSGDGTLEGGVASGTQAAFTNDNLAGVAGCPEPVGDPTTAANGFEILVPLSEIGNPQLGSSIRVFALLSSGSGDGFFSNQALPSFADPANNSDPSGNGAYNDVPDGYQPGFNFAAAYYGGQQWASYTLQACVPVSDCSGDIDGDGDTDDSDLGLLLNAFNSGPGGDLDGDGDTDDSDLGLLLNDFGCN